MTSSWFFFSTLNYDARSTTHQILKAVPSTQHETTRKDSVDQAGNWFIITIRDNHISTENTHWGASWFVLARYHPCDRFRAGRWENLKERYHLEDLHKRIILKWIFEEIEWVDVWWTRLMWLGVGARWGGAVLNAAVNLLFPKMRENFFSSWGTVIVLAITKHR